MQSTNNSSYRALSPYYKMVPRADLVKKMKQASLKKPVYIFAPGGYGKTVAAQQWLAEMKGPTVWLTISMSDNDPARFCRRLCKAIQDTSPSQKRRKPSYGSNKPALEQISDALASLPKQSSRSLLVIDDLHALTNAEVKAILAQFITLAPSHIRLCLISRSDPQELFGSNDACAVFTQQDLAFSFEETAELFAMHTVKHTVDQVTSCTEATEGWPIYLSAMAANGTCEFEPLPDNDVIPTLLEFFETTVWQLWDEDARKTILQLSIPDTLTPRLAESLTGRTSGEALLGQLSRQKGAFLEKTGRAQWRFHDLFREFLQTKAAAQLETAEQIRLHRAVASHCFDQKEYLNAAQHYLAGNDDEGLTRCFIAANRFHEDAGNQSIETSLAFTKQYLLDLPPDFIAGNAFILSKCALVAFCEGDGDRFSHYAEILAAQISTLASTYPMMLETALFNIALDNHLPLRHFAKQVQARIEKQPDRLHHRREAQTHTITLNLPLFHRSMRDYSELSELRDDDIELIRNSFGVMIGDEYPPIERCLVAGIYFERNELRAALFPALEAYRGLHEHTQPETRFCVLMALHAVFAALGAAREADRILKELSAFAATDKGRFLMPNVQAAETLAALRTGDAARAEGWIEAYGTERDELHFYKIFRHFVSLRALIATERFDEATCFGTRLLELATSYVRPLDQIEAGILTALASKDVDRGKSLTLLKDALDTARRYGFTRLFVAEGAALLPLLWEIRDCPKTLRVVGRFATRIIDEIYEELAFTAPKRPAPRQRDPLRSQDGQPAQTPRLSNQQKAMLQYLDQGLTYSQIADALHIKRGTVKTHVLQLYKRLDVHSSPDALIKARMLGLLKEAE